MFRPTWSDRAILLRVLKKSNGYTISGPTCFFPMMPGAGRQDCSEPPVVSHSLSAPSLLPRPCVLYGSVRAAEPLLPRCPYIAQSGSLWGRMGSCSLAPGATWKPPHLCECQLAQQQRQALHPVEGIEVVDILVQAAYLRSDAASRDAVMQDATWSYHPLPPCPLQRSHSPRLSPTWPFTGPPDLVPRRGFLHLSLPAQQAHRSFPWDFVFPRKYNRLE